ncbi:hypothetical protein JQ617_23985 [Bradyrhizobium sp. KB893862 SZCCT0404]|uniref:amine dehydrogenase large subunit n=1 Tax=Bradyrhizobium sp. KB893862 SZCCT0404 TaxID=2807672 RepID=UPI001BAC8955|nr:amine dehydrogenase large subunit [Bradyrhizobium sp. KB893862 SZCCT0404]MBR1177033.1 hypothetical protein [Bradyrhizobium sp. KB893862 SZCCT0404]
MAADPAGSTFPEPLPLEPTPASAVLPKLYPQTWLFVSDFNAPSIIDGRIAIVDLASDTRNLRGQIRAAQWAEMAMSKSRNEIYVAETFYSRLTRGDRTDAIAIYDPETLRQTGEIVLPGGKRYQVMLQPNAFQLTGDERRALVFNFTPAASVTVVDMVGRKVLNEIGVPGCSLVYPMGEGGFFTLCADGGLSAFTLDEKAGIARRQDVASFNDIDRDPMFMIPARVAGTWYFATFQGEIRPIIASGDEVKVEPAFSVLNDADSKEGWKPSGWQIIAADDHGRLYLLMRKDSHEGNHKDGGTRVLVIDSKTHARLADYPLRVQSISISATHGESPLLAATAATGGIDVYDAVTGRHLRSLGANIVNTPVIMAGAR